MCTKERNDELKMLIEQLIERNLPRKRKEKDLLIKIIRFKCFFRKKKEHIKQDYSKYKT